MADDWILDVLTDLGTFAETNGYARLAAQLEQARRVAVEEVTQGEGADAQDAFLHGSDAREDRCLRTAG